MAVHKGPQRQSWSSIQLRKSFVKRMTIRAFGILASASSTSPEEAMVIANRSNVASNSMALSTGSVASSQAKEKKKCWPVHRVVSSVVSGNWAECGNNWTKDLPCCLLEISAPLFEQCYAFLPCRNISRNHREKKHQQSTKYKYHHLHHGTVWTIVRASSSQWSLGVFFEHFLQVEMLNRIVKIPTLFISH